MAIKKIRTRPVVKEAVQLTWANWNQICEFVPKPWFVRGVFLDENGNPMPDGRYRFGERTLGLILKTLESNEFIASEFDWIIKGVNGEFYACKPDVFAKTYEIVEELPTGPIANLDGKPCAFPTEVKVTPHD